jgi:hypothetical protein
MGSTGGACRSANMSADWLTAVSKGTGINAISVWVLPSVK